MTAKAHTNLKQSMTRRKNKMYIVKNKKTRKVIGTYNTFHDAVIAKIEHEEKDKGSTYDITECATFEIKDSQAINDYSTMEDIQE